MQVPLNSLIDLILTQCISVTFRILTKKKRANALRRWVGIETGPLESVEKKEVDQGSETSQSQGRKGFNRVTVVGRVTCCRELGKMKTIKYVWC